jgi:branched-chain amino acid transport system ATP-binding protein
MSMPSIGSVDNSPTPSSVTRTGEDVRASLSLDGLHLNFGGVAALAGVSLAVSAGELFAIIGPNGAGKTSIFNCISGIYVPTRGRILFGGQDITDWKPHRRAQLRIGRTFQNIALFKGMTVLDNVKMGRHIHLRSGVFACALYYGRAAREELAHRATIEREIIDLLELQDFRNKVVGTLPYGVQKRVELARALALDPALLLLDEPTAGMNAEETEDMVRFILYVKRVKRLTAVMIEHDMGVVMDISDRVAVLDFGRKIAEGAPLHVQKDPAVIKAYLGEDFEVT